MGVLSKYYERRKRKTPKTEAQKKATAKYIKSHYTVFKLRFKKDADADLITWLDSKESKNACIIQALRELMEKEKRDI